MPDELQSPREEFTAEEQAVLRRHFSNVDAPVFVLTNLPDVVKGALFARYSRSPKSLRRLFLDEFYDGSDAGPGSDVGLERAQKLYNRVFLEYGDDSVAQLVSVHLAVEGASNILTKLLERGRLMSYLEQSTRYVPYNDRPGGRWRYVVPPEVRGSHLEAAYTATLDHAFELYSDLLPKLQEHLRADNPRPAAVSEGAYRQSIRAKACDILRGLLPAATASNVGIYGSAQGLEGLILRLRSHPLAEAQEAADAILAELQKVIPTFVERVARPDRGGVWAGYLSDTAAAASALAARFVSKETTDRATVRLTAFDLEGETKVAAAALYEFSHLSDAEALAATRAMPTPKRREIIAAYAGKRNNRRHRPGRAFERTSYRFDVVGDYGVFRDLQRHRLLTIEWQELTPDLRYDVPPEIDSIGARAAWDTVMHYGSELYDALKGGFSPLVAQYSVPMAYRIRFVMEMNAREAMHVIELRTSAQAHRNYRDLCLEMLRLIREEAGHTAIAGAMTFVGEGAGGLERLAAEQRNAERRQKRTTPKT